MIYGETMVLLDQVMMIFTGLFSVFVYVPLVPLFGLEPLKEDLLWLRQLILWRHHAKTILWKNRITPLVYHPITHHLKP